MKTHRDQVKLIDNERIDPWWCPYCDADGQPHSAFCPMGERYAQVQQLGGVPCTAADRSDPLAWLMR